MDEKMDEKMTEDRSFTYHLKLTPRELDKLLFCSKFAGLQVSEFLRMLINDSYISIFGNGVKNE